MKKYLIGILLFSSVVSAVQADVWSERKALTQLKEEVRALRILAKQAQAVSDDRQRDLFQYHVLLNDLKAIESGIEHHLTKPFEPVAQVSVEAVGKNYSKHKQYSESSK